MTTFNMQGQQVGEQMIAGRDMYIRTEQNRADVMTELHRLSTTIAQAQQQGHVPVQVAMEAEEQIAKAVQQAEQAQPNKKTLIDHVNTAKSLLESAQGVAGIVSSLAALAQIIQKSF